MTDQNINPNPPYTPADGSTFRDGYPFQVWTNISTWNPELGMHICCHCATLGVANEQAGYLRRVKIWGRNGLTQKNYYGRVTIRRHNTELSAIRQFAEKGWRVRWQTGPKVGRCSTITRRNWEIKPHNPNLSGGGPLSNKTTEAESRRPLE